MRDQFVPYNLALKLKELGFDEPCLASYTQNAYGSFAQKLQYFVEPVDGINSDHVFVAAPLWQQAFDFLLKKHYLYSAIIPTITMYWTFKITTVVDGEIEVPPYKNVDATDYSTYEEAREACLEKLIQILEEEK